jgi:glycosyltransferase involved in cell wall biosynthesis
MEVRRLPVVIQDVSVVIPVRNGGENFVRCLESVAMASPPPGEVIVVVDGGEDNSWSVAQSSGAKVIREPVSGGPARARNRGFREATGDILLFIDADVTVPSGLIGQVAEIFDREPELSALIGSYDDEPGARNFFSMYKNLLHHFTHQTAHTRATTFWGACGAIRREVFLAMGGFDESYGKPSIEDIDLGYRLTGAGHKIRLDKSLQVKHMKRWGFFSLLRSDFFCRAIPWTRLILRDGRFIKDLNLQISSRICVVASYGILIALAGSIIRPGLFWVVVCLAGLVLTLNSRLILFFRRKGGGWFATRAMAWHYFYFLYSGLAFAIESSRHHTRQWILARQG